MLKILKYLSRKEWAVIAFSVVFIAAQVWLDLKLPDYMSEITQLVKTEGSAMRDVWAAGGKMLLCAFGSLISAVIVGFFAARIAASYSKRLRGLIFDKVESFSLTEINRFSTASLITRSTNDIMQVQMVVSMGLQVIIKAPILAVWAIVKIAGKNFEWTLATGIAVAVLMVMILTIVLLALPKFKRIQKLTDSLNNVTRENLTGLRVVRAYNAERYQEQKFEAVNTELTGIHLFTSRVMSIMSPGMSLIMNGLALSIYLIGAYLINNAGMADKLNLFSDMIVFSSYSMQVVMAFMMLTMIFIFLPRAAVSAGRLNEVLDTKPAVTDGPLSDVSTELTGQVEFRNVSFRYSDSSEYVLHDISFTARQGETVAFIGSTGSGKSTLINLVPRFYDATEDEVLIDGVNVREYTQYALHNKIGYVPQRAVLFGGSVAFNVAYGDNGRGEPDEAEIRRAVSIAQAADFVEKMEGGYDAQIAQGGTNVSGGQKQRLSIARAVCRKPEIYIFDDSFSALDYKTDRLLRGILKKETAGVTSLIVAQRIGTIIDADKIVVLDEGRAVGIGTHKELLKNCEVYREIAYSQLSKEELENE